MNRKLDFEDTEASDAELYPIRCKSCNNPLAQLEKSYKELIKHNYSREEALRELGVVNLCCMMAMQNPTIIFFDVENRSVIEGIKDFDSTSLRENKSSAPFTANMKVNANAREKGSVVNKKSFVEGGILASGLKPLGEKNDESEAIVVDNVSYDNAFKAPSIIGFPTINDTGEPLLYIDVGSGYTTRVLSGRTYLAR
jgi:DNA-directed RNA polymerase subunit N (RpoN/RPB10)